MNLFKQFRRNDDLIKHGARFVAGMTDDEKEISFMIARAHQSNEVFQTAVQRGLEAKRRTLDSLAKSDKIAEGKLRSKIVLSAFAEHCIKSWENVRDENDQVLEYSEESIQKIATMLPELIEEMFEFASDDSNYVGEFDEKEAVKN